MNTVAMAAAVTQSSRPREAPGVCVVMGSAARDCGLLERSLPSSRRGDAAGAKRFYG
jgi:hypothetical protein